MRRLLRRGGLDDAAIDEAESEITSRSGEPSGLLRINAPLTFGVRHLAQLWGRFADAHPKVSLEIDLSDRIVDLVEEGYDLAVRITNRLDPQLVVLGGFLAALYAVDPDRLHAAVGAAAARPQKPR